MEELDLLKKDWKRKENSFKQVSEKDIYTMLHKKSSSIVKWILIISILEFVLFRALDFIVIFDDDYTERMKFMHMYSFEMIFTPINYVVLIVFIALFYRNFKTINTSSSTKKLMSDILKTRRTVKYYVWYNLLLAGVTSFFAIHSEITYNSELSKLSEKNEVMMILVFSGVIFLLLLAFWVFYRLVYGILIRRLYANYKELKKIDL